MFSGLSRGLDLVCLIFISDDLCQVTSVGIIRLLDRDSLTETEAVSEL